MPGLLLDDGAYQPLSVPSRTTIGRAPGNDIQPDSQSVSKNHGALDISVRRGKVVTTLEDLDSRNGTYTGPDTLEMERVKGKKEIEFGWFVRFGNAGKFFRYLEEAPKDAVIVEPEPPTTRSQHSKTPLAIEVPLAAGGGGPPVVENRLAPFQSPATFNEAGTAMQWQHQPAPPEDKNMTISIQYPTAGRQPLQPVTISIDPQQQQQQQQQQMQQMMQQQMMMQQQQQQQQQRYSGYQMPAPLPLPLPMAAQELPPQHYMGGDYGGEPGGYYHNQHQQGRYTPANRRSSEWDGPSAPAPGPGSLLPPPLGGGGPAEAGWEPAQRQPGSLPPLHPGGSSLDGRLSAQPAPQGGNGRESGGLKESTSSHRASQVTAPGVPPLPGSPVRGVGQGREPIVSAYQANKLLPDKPLAKLLRRIWLPIDDLPMTILTDALLFELIGPPDQSAPRSTATSPLPSIESKIPDYLLAEAAADRFQDPEASVVGRIGGVIAELSDFFKQSVAGARLSGEEGGSSSAELDVALLSVISNILGDSIATLQNVFCGTFLQALRDANADGCDNSVWEMMERTITRLDKLLAFVNNEFCRDLCQGMTTAEMYCISSVALDYILSELDAANALIWSVGLKTDLPSVKAKMGLEPTSPRASSDGANAKNAINAELDELRRLKGKNARGGDAAVAAQIMLLEKENMMANAMGGKLPKGKGFKGDMARLMQQELAGPMREQKLLRALRIWDRNHMRIQFHGFSRWKSNVDAIKSNYSSKLKRFARLLLTRREKLIGRAFHKWDKQTGAKRTAFLIEQQTAVLKYEMCGMEARIHELSSGNALAASLAAERALNKELAGTNMELRLSLQELDEKFLEVCNAPPAHRKGMVRDVFFGREDDIAQARREARLLKDELQRLYDLGIEASTADKASERILPRAPVPPEFREKIEKSAPVPLRDRAAHALVGPRDGSPPRSLSPPRDRSSVRPPPLALRMADPKQAAAAGQRPLPTMKKDGYTAPSPAAKVLTRQDATLVIAQEVRRMATTITRLQEEREELRIKSTTDSYTNSQQGLAIQALQRRITDRERSLGALRALLRQRLGEKGLMEMTVALEEVGVGNSALLKDPPVDREKEPEKAGILPGILEHRNRGDKLAAIDGGLAYVPPPSDDESGGE